MNRISPRCAREGHLFGYPEESYHHHIMQTRQVCQRVSPFWRRPTCDAFIDRVAPSDWEPDTLIERFVDQWGQTVESIYDWDWGRPAKRWSSPRRLSTAAVLAEIPWLRDEEVVGRR